MSHLWKAKAWRPEKVIAGICAILLLSAPAQGQSNAGQVNLKKSRVFVFVGKTGFGHEHGVVGRIKQGTVQLGAEKNAGRLIFDMTSFQADTKAARQYVGLSGVTDASTKKKVNANMRGVGVLNIRKYSTASFTLESSRLLPEKSKRGFPQYRLEGKFTLHGVTQPIKFVADAEPKNGWIHLRGGFVMLQTKFGITPFSKALGVVGVTDQLKIWGDLWIAEPKGATTSDSSAQKG